VSGSGTLDLEAMSHICAILTRSTKLLVLSVIASMMAGCGAGCLYGESGNVVVREMDSPPTPARLLEVVGDALRPMGFVGQEAAPITPRPLGYWDYTFSVGARKFAPRERVDVHIKFEDFSISLSDFARGSKASAFDRSVLEAIKARIRSQLGGDITFTHTPTPGFCLGP
jgi:hypothetical protein